MSSEIVPFKAEHLKHLLSQEINKKDAVLFSDNTLKAIEDDGHYFTLFYKDKIMACGGITPYWPGRGELWAMMSEDAKKHIVVAFRSIKRFLDLHIKKHYLRIELAIDIDLPVAKRRAELLGFKLEIENARRYLPDGRDCSLYSMVRDIL